MATDAFADWGGVENESGSRFRAAGRERVLRAFTRSRLWLR